jgi:hypothetical protein
VKAKNFKKSFTKIFRKNMKSYYYAINGDDIGKSLEKSVLEDNIQAIEILSFNVKEALSKIETDVTIN